jgi:hypothetical protein
MKRAIAAVFVLACLAAFVGYRSTKAHDEALAAKVDAVQALIAKHQRHAPPKLVEVSRPDWNPRAPEYNPVGLWKSGATGTEIFDAEPRLEPWATKVEAKLLPMMRADLAKLLPNVTNVDLECHTATCRVTYDGPKNRMEQIQVMTVLSVLYPAAAASGPGAHEYIASFLGAPHFEGHREEVKGDADGLLAEITENRAGLLADIEAGKAPSGVYRYISRDGWLALNR